MITAGKMPMRVVENILIKLFEQLIARIFCKKNGEPGTNLNNKRISNSFSDKSFFKLFIFEKYFLLLKILNFFFKRNKVKTPSDREIKINKLPNIVPKK